jgi:hypothetical protein
MYSVSHAENIRLLERRRWRPGWLAGLGLAVAGLSVESIIPVASAAESITFNMVRSAAAQTANCLVGATATVFIQPLGPVEQMTVVAEKLPANTEFDLFVIQLPNAPFGLSWYQGDIETNADGLGVGVFIGRFSIETFIVAPGSGSAPVVHSDGQFPDADTNPQTDPVHTFHLGLWFNSPDDAAKAGCPNTETPFNGDHTAGIQALSTRGFAKEGPLQGIQSSGTPAAPAVPQTPPSSPAQ